MLIGYAARFFFFPATYCNVLAWYETALLEEDRVTEGLLFVTSPQPVIILMNNGNGGLDSKEKLLQ